MTKQQKHLLESIDLNIELLKLHFTKYSSVDGLMYSKKFYKVVSHLITLLTKLMVTVVIKDME